MTLAMMQINGWSVATDGVDDEPRILDVELGAKLGFSEPRFIRKLIRSLLKRKFLSDSEVRAVASQTSTNGGRPGVAYLLNDTGTLLVILRSDTKIANLITRQVVEVFKVARLRGPAPPVPPAAPAQEPVAVPVLPNSPPLGHKLYRRRVERLCRRAVRRTGESIHRVHGELKILYGASGIYRISGVHYGEVRRHLQAWARARRLPTSMPGRLLKAAADSVQCVFPFMAVYP